MTVTGGTVASATRTTGGSCGTGEINPLKRPVGRERGPLPAVFFSRTGGADAEVDRLPGHARIVGPVPGRDVLDRDPQRVAPRRQARRDVKLEVEEVIAARRAAAVGAPPEV